MRVGGSTTANESILLRDYFKLFRKLGLDKELRLEEKTVLKELAEADRNDNIRPLLVGWRRLTGESALAPVKMRERLQERSSRTLKVVLPAYLTTGIYGKFIHRVRDRLVENLHLTSGMDNLPEKEVRWDLLAVHLREGVLDFCDDLYYLTENRGHLVEIVQLGWCSTCTAYVRKDSKVYEELRLLQGRGFAQSMRSLLERYTGVAVGVLGDTPAASEANRRLSPLLAANKLISKGNEEDLLRWLEAAERDDDYRLAICDHVVAERLTKLASGERYSSAPKFKFDQKAPLGIVCPREDREWRKDLSKAIADSLIELQPAEDQNGAIEVWRAIAGEFKQHGLDALSLAELRTSLLLDMPFDQAIEWDRRFHAPAATNTGAEVQE